MTSLVVGANSFIASQLIAVLKKEGSVYGAYHTHTDNLHNDIENIRISEIQSLRKNFATVFIVGAYVPENMSSFSREKMFESNIALCASVCSSFPDSKIVLVSSVSVYNSSGRVCNEDSETGGLNEYGVSKLWSEHIVKRNAGYAIVRLSSVYGPGMKQNTIMPIYIKQALEAGHINIWGDGTRKQNYVHVKDVVQYLISAARNPGNGIYLGTAPESISNLELAQIIAGHTGCTCQFTGADQSPSFYYDNRQTVEKLNINNTIPLHKGIEELILWQKKYWSPA